MAVLQVWRCQHVRSVPVKCTIITIPTQTCVNTNVQWFGDFDKGQHICAMTVRFWNLVFSSHHSDRVESRNGRGQTFDSTAIYQHCYITDTRSTHHTWDHVWDHSLAPTTRVWLDTCTLRRPTQISSRHSWESWWCRLWGRSWSKR